ncbi:conserved hypothetical protein [Talaromyces stipitatus ATCC 10500]|uniref:Uncharacterized protein n=1 Tax=Talaromyces stipitatus (strain ATCC 10500 / CBS 375.48 / QM 6759 / NRRL 1006) TaxID=441959 RepID=B8MCQ3_TALSN|nr:uncharacterized protein TSTA_126630 [Talaromyces stipitatus ATCC 10500]EED18955.1 conserved hypothetical protein [Talaromyces stipitatus ATCC 10500]
MTASLLTLDVKGAFDAVLPGRLIRRLREQGWPTNLVLWIASFTTGRSVQIQLDGEIGPSTDIVCGLPQGSPQAVSACVLHKAYYGAETRWPGYTRPGPSQTSNRVREHLEKLTKVILTGARAVLPVFRTTPISVLYRESGFSPPEIELDRIALPATVRLRRLDPYHPLRRRAEQVASSGRQTSRFARRILALPNSEQINPLQYAPWHPRESRENAQARIGAPMGRTKKQAAANFTFLRSSLSYGHGKEVFDAETEATLAGAQAAIAYPTAQFATNLWICLDNLEVATRLLSPSTGSSQEVFESFRTLAAAWPLRERLPHTKNGSIQIRWVPGHTKIPENEAADFAAKEGAASASLSPSKSSYASLKRYAKTQALSATQIRWQTVAPQTYQDLEITTSPKRPGELLLNRLNLGRVIAARTGYGDFADYHEHFNHDDAHLLCRCGARKAPLHFFFCHIVKRRAPRPSGPPSEVISFLLGTAKGA